MVTRDDVANRLKAYLQRRLGLPELVDWAEDAMRMEEFASAEFDAIRDAVATLGLADVRAFGLTWEDCERLLSDLGYRAKIEIHKAS